MSGFGIKSNGDKVKQKYIDAYMDAAKRFAELSHATRLKVGAVIVKDDTLTYGYNGMPSGWDNTCEDMEYTYDSREANSPDWKYDVETKKYYRTKTKPEVLHAESNAIAKLAKSTLSGQGADIFITHSPCMECAKLIHQAGIKRVFFGAYYRDDSGIKFLEKSGVTVVTPEMQEFTKTH